MIASFARWVLVLAAMCASHFVVRSARAEGVVLSNAEIPQVLKHGPWPMPWSPDPSNRVSGRPEAISFGQKLFFDPRLSSTGTIACVTCHRPDKGWSDGRKRGEGMTVVDRNTQTLFDVRLNRWFGWDGQGDSLWAQSIRPILDPREMDGSAAKVAGLLRNDRAMSAAYHAAFNRQPRAIDDEALLVDAAKALAAFQETVVSPRTAFDDFRDALGRGDRAAAAQYPASAQRGLSIFVGRGKCDVCHTGPAFTSGEFHDAGVPYFIEPGRVDPGRHGGIAKLKGSPYNLLGRYNDEPKRANGWATKHVVSLHRNFGEFKVPSLRGLVHSAPYMHNGSLATLEEVVRHYSDIDIERLHADGERVLRPLHLSDGEIADVVSFLKTLSK